MQRQETQVIYNGSCPICSREIDLYRRRADASGAPVVFRDLNGMDLTSLGISADEAAQRLHVIENGQLLAGTDAFLALWRITPGFGWLARLLSLPGLRQVADAIYERALAPWLYRRHLARKKART